MVSFQCNNCTDVIKKPKLDQHYSRCHGNFDCIDCSKSFNSPAEWKGHTSCISEAEKYQKSLYKGPKTRNGTNDQENGDNMRNGDWRNFNEVNGRGRGRGRGEYPSSNRGSRGGRGFGRGGGRLPYAATGPNDTPLGSPHREFGRSPSGDTTQIADDAKAEVASKPEAVDDPVERKERKEKKRKATGDDEEKTVGTNDVPASKKAKVDTTTNVVEITPALDEEHTKKERKKAKSKKESTGKEAVDEGKAAKRSKKKKAEETQTEIVVEASRTQEEPEQVKERKSKKGKKAGGKDEAQSDIPAVSSEQVTEKKEKKRKNKGDDSKNGDEGNGDSKPAPAPSEQVGMDANEKAGKRKSKKNKDQGGEEAHISDSGDKAAIAKKEKRKRDDTVNEMGEVKKRKKRTKEGESVEMDVEGDEDEGGSKSKTKGKKRRGRHSRDVVQVTV